MNETKDLNKGSNKNMLFVIIAIVAVILIAIVVILLKGGSNVTGPTSDNIPEITNNNPATTSPDEIAPSVSVVTLTTSTPEVIEASVSVATGTSLVTKENKVITAEGTPVKLNVMPASPDAPTESAPIQGTVADAANTVKLSVSAAGFVPKELRVKEGQLVNFVLTSTDDYTHVWLPDDKALIATVLGVAGHETRMKSWNAPKKGTYTFRCDVPGHAGRGETGSLIVE